MKERLNGQITKSNQWLTIKPYKLYYLQKEYGISFKLGK